MERFSANEIDSLKLGEGDIFHGEGILAVTGAPFRSGVSRVGGYRGAPVSHWVMAPRPDLETGQDASGSVPVAVTPLRREPANVH